MSRLIFTAFLAMVALSSAVRAHESKEMYIILDAGERGLSGLIELRVEDMEGVIAPVGTSPDDLTRSRFDAAAQDAYTYFEGALSFLSDGRQISVDITSHEFQEAEIGDFAVMAFETSLDSPMSNAIEVDLATLRPRAGMAGAAPAETLPNIDRAVVILRNNARTGLRDNYATPSAIFTPGSGRQTISLEAPSRIARFLLFLTNGFKHILEGHDHVAFVIALLLPSVLIAGSGAPIAGFGSGLWSMLKVVTVFTVAHSITLSLAALGLFTYWGELVEFVIALSVLIVALQNIRGQRGGWVYLSVFGLGLLHGLGFASVLAPYGQYTSELWLSLLGFNLGVEIGQALIIAVLFPVLFLARRWSLYRMVICNGGSALLALVALYWMWNRGWNVLATLS